MQSPSPTIVETLTSAIIDHRLPPGTKLAEQTLADHFGVSRTLVRQALFQLAHSRLVTLEPARGAFVSTPSAVEARQVFAVRRMLEAQMTRAFVRSATLAKITVLRAHVKREAAAFGAQTAARRTQLLGQFPVRMAELMGNDVLAQLLRELISRCALISLVYQSTSEAVPSHQGHEAIVAAMAARDEDLAAQLMHSHLERLEASLAFDQKRPAHAPSEVLLKVRPPAPSTAKGFT